MKKLALTALATLISFSALAAPAGETFTGFSVGLGLTSAEYQDTKRFTGANISVDYGFDYGSNFVGLVEGKYKFNHSTLVDQNKKEDSLNIKERGRIDVSYLQGYRVTSDFLPYVKVGYNLISFKANGKLVGTGYEYSRAASETNSGFHYGVGAKYAISSDLELGAEYIRTHTKFDGEKAKGNAVGGSIHYRF